MAAGIKKMKRSAEDAGLQDCFEGCSKKPIWISGQEETTAPPEATSLGPYLGRLPAELRVLIYEFAYSDAVIDVKDSPLYTKKKRTRRSEIKKLGVCRLFYVESREVMLQNVTFASTNQFAILEYRGTHDAEFVRNSIRTISMRDGGLWAAEDISQLFPNLRKLILRVKSSDLALRREAGFYCMFVTGTEIFQLDARKTLQQIAKIPTLRDVELRVEDCSFCALELQGDLNGPDVKYPSVDNSSPRFTEPSNCFLHMMAKGGGEVLVLERLWKESRDGRQKKALLESLKWKGADYVALKEERRSRPTGSGFDKEERRWFLKKMARVQEKCYPEVVGVDGLLIE